MKLEKADILSKLSILGEYIKRFRFIIVFIIFSSMYGYIILKVNEINLQKPDNNEINEKVTSAPSARINQELADKITGMENQNVQIKTLFNEARKNPFDE